MSHQSAPPPCAALQQQLAEQNQELVYQRQAAFTQQMSLVKSAEGVNWATSNPNAPVNPAPLPPSPITPINPNPSAPANNSTIARATVNPSAGMMR